MYYHVNLISKIIILIIFIHFIGKSGKRTSLILSGLFLLIVILRWVSHGKTPLPQTDLRGVITLHTHISKHGIKYNGYLPHIHLLMKTMWHSWKLQDIYQIFSQLSPLWSSDSWESDAVSITELQGVLFSVSSVWMRGSRGTNGSQTSQDTTWTFHMKTRAGEQLHWGSFAPVCHWFSNSVHVQRKKLGLSSWLSPVKSD